jgi:rubrerythrin
VIPPITTNLNNDEKIIQIRRRRKYMKAVFFVPSESFSKAKNTVYGDDMLSRQTINFRESKALGMEKEGYYLEIDGSEESIAHAKEVLAELAKEVDKDEKEKILKKIEEQEDSAAQGFGTLFG